MENEKLYHLLKRFLNLEGYRLNNQELRFQLLSHPSYPSVHALTGVLSHFKIANVAAQLEVSAAILTQLPQRFICTMKNAHELFMVTKTKDSIHLDGADDDSVSLSTQEFLKNWSGVAILIATEDEKGDHILKKNSLIHTYRHVLTLVFICVLFFLGTPSVQTAIYFLLCLFGLSASYLILKQEIGDAPSILNNICGNTTSNGCSTVLDSKGALLFNRFKLSDLGGTYFMGLVLLGIAGSWSFIHVLPYLSLLSVLSLPITFYSIYYQKVVLKEWCPLCLLVVATLWLQFLVLFTSNTELFIPFLDFNSFISVLFIALLSSFSWYLLRKSALTSKEFENLKMTATKFKRNFEIFDALIQKNTKVPTEIANLQGNEIVFGNPLAPVRILLITHPLCQFCKEAHSDLESIYKNNDDNVALTIRFNVDAKFPQSLGFKVAHRLSELFESDRNCCYDALHEAFDVSTNLKSWLEKWSEAQERFPKSLLEQQQKWCLENGIDFTPALFINGQKYPDEYERKELAFFIDELVEQSEQGTAV